MEEVKIFNPEKYEVYVIEGDKNNNSFRVIPFTEWLPADFKNVNCFDGFNWKKMYYSPAYNAMCDSLSHQKTEIKDLQYWLKNVKERDNIHPQTNQEK